MIHQDWLLYLHGISAVKISLSEVTTLPSLPIKFGTLHTYCNYIHRLCWFFSDWCWTIINCGIYTTEENATVAAHLFCKVLHMFWRIACYHRGTQGISLDQLTLAEDTYYQLSTTVHNKCLPHLETPSFGKWNNMAFLTTQKKSVSMVFYFIALSNI